VQSSENIRIVLGTWEYLREDAYLVRQEVFVMEQSVPAEMEWDDDDTRSIHAIAYDAEGQPVATGRLLHDGHIGRMAVRKTVRGLGLGGKVLQHLMRRAAQEGHHTLVLHAQVHAQPFYEAYGFVAQGEVFMDVGIPHITMARVCPDINGTDIKKV
jgi:predicted GNAT family N-acyltransferase